MRRGIFAKVAALAAMIALLAAACGREEKKAPGPGATGGQEQPQSTLEAVRERGTLRCGVNETVPGFGFLTAEGNIEGFDVDFCRAIAVAVFNDPEAEPELVPISADERFNALRSGEYDVLTRNTTWTSSRDGAEGVAFAHVNFYDGQAMMVRADSEFQSLEDMNDTAICVTTGTTTELNLADVFGDLGLNFEAVTFEENPQLQEAFIQERCDGWTSDRSQLAGIRSAWPADAGGPESLVILDDVMSKEPLAPAVLDGDSQWYDVVSWTVKGIILAEELGVDSGNVADQAQNPDNPQIGNLLGAPTEEGAPFDPGFGLDPDFMVNVITAVGNYGEIFDRHVGPNTPLGLERGQNALWTEGGLHYAPPSR
jgi:general L-amino acid transport system substrate-binding protein